MLAFLAMVQQRREPKMWPEHRLPQVRIPQHSGYTAVVLSTVVFKISVSYVQIPIMASDYFVTVYMIASCILHFMQVEYCSCHLAIKKTIKMKICALRLLFVYTSIPSHWHLRHNVNALLKIWHPKRFFPDQCTTTPPLSPALCDAVGHCTHACKGNSLPPIYSWYLGTIENGFEGCSHLDCDEATPAWPSLKQRLVHPKDGIPDMARVVVLCSLPSQLCGRDQKEAVQETGGASEGR